MIDLIVSSMPSLPAFINYLRGGAPPTSVSFEPLSQRGLKKSSKYPRGHGRAGMGLDDPSLLDCAKGAHGDAGYEELTELEGQKRMQIKR